MSLDEPTSDDRLRARLKVLDEAVRDLGDDVKNLRRQLSALVGAVERLRPGTAPAEVFPAAAEGAAEPPHAPPHAALQSAGASREEAGSPHPGERAAGLAGERARPAGVPGVRGSARRGGAGRAPDPGGGGRGRRDRGQRERALPAAAR